MIKLLVAYSPQDDILGPQNTTTQLRLSISVNNLYCITPRVLNTRSGGHSRWTILSRIQSISD